MTGKTSFLLTTLAIAIVVTSALLHAADERRRPVQSIMQP